MGIETLTHQFEAITLTVNIMNLILTISASIALLLISESYHDSMFSKSMIFFFGSVSQMGIIQLFFLLIELTIIRVDPTTVSLIWHFAYYLGIILFFEAIRTMMNISQLKGSRVFSNGKFMIVSMTIIASLLMLGLSGLFQNLNKIYPIGTKLHEVGIYHYISLIITVAVLYYHSQLTNKISGAFGIITSPIFYSLIIMCFIHVFELAAESWMLFSVDYDLIEGIEIWIWLPVYICLNYGFWKLYALLKRDKRI